MLIYYIYAYVRKDFSPYYIGKGKGDRAFSKDHSVAVPKNKTQIIFLEKNLTEEHKRKISEARKRFTGH